MILKWLNLILFVACMIVAVLHFQLGNVATGTVMACLGVINLLMGVV